MTGVLGSLQGKTAVITGGASGIGLAMAQQFGSQGMNLVIADVEQGALEIAMAQLEAEGFSCCAMQLKLVLHWNQVHE